MAHVKAEGWQLIGYVHRQKQKLAIDQNGLLLKETTRQRIARETNTSEGYCTLD